MKGNSIRGKAPLFNVSVVDCTTEKSKVKPAACRGGGSYMARLNYCNIDVLNQSWEEGSEYSYEKQPRPFFGVCYIISGSIVYKTEKGETCASGGDVVIIKKGINYKAVFGCGGTRDILINFYSEKEKGGEEFFGFVEDEIIVFEKKGDLKKLFSEILNLGYIGGRECLVKAKLYEITDALLASDAEDDFLKRIREIIEADFSANIKKEEFAKMFSVSLSTFQRMLKNKCGKTFYQYKTEIKMAKAKELLGEKKYSTEEIAEILGFFDSAHFFKTFKKFEGISPKCYQKELYKM